MVNDENGMCLPSYDQRCMFERVCCHQYLEIDRPYRVLCHASITRLNEARPCGCACACIYVYLPIVVYHREQFFHQMHVGVAEHPIGSISRPYPNHHEGTHAGRRDNCRDILAVRVCQRELE